MKCLKCGYESLVGAHYCEKCGYSLASVVRPSQVGNKVIRPAAGVAPTIAGQPNASWASPTPAASGPAVRPRVAPVAAPPPSASNAAAAPAAPQASPQFPLPVVPPLAASPAPAPPVPSCQPDPAKSVEAAHTQAQEQLKQNAYAALEGSDNSVWFLVHDKYVVGRRSGDSSQQVDLDLSSCSVSASVSRRHAVLKRSSEGLLVQDLESANGTFLNGQRLLAGCEAVAKENDSLRFGAAAFVVHLR